MIEELASASKLLYTALARYASACSAIQKCYVQANQLNGEIKVQQLLDCITSELPLVASYEKLLKQAAAKISLVRNSHIRVVPINALPNEILTRIFHLTLGSQPCISRQGGSEKFLFPKYPDLLSYVCSRWRRLAIGSPALWAHIDLAPCHPSHLNLLSRAAVHANRAGQLPLHIRVASLEYLVPYSDGDRNALEEFLKSVGNRIKSLEVVAGDISKADDELADINILDSCLECCRPEVLTQLTIANNANEFLYFIHAGDFDDLYIHDALVLRPSHGFLESLWDHVTVLQLYGFYPYWTSKAYHNLVELCLTRGDHNIPISESQLVGILRSSPGLKFLRLDLFITDTLPDNASVEPVHLDSLEVLNLIALNFGQLGSFLRWLVPGSLPLKLSVTGSTEHSEALLSDNEIRKFFSRSKVNKLCLVGMAAAYFQLSNLIGLLPHLQVLAFDRLIASFQPALYPEQYNDPVTQICLDKLYFARCKHDLDGLQWLLKRGLVQTLTLWECSFTQERDIPNAYVGRDAAHDVLRNNVPVMEVITGNKPNLIDDWD